MYYREFSTFVFLCLCLQMVQSHKYGLVQSWANCQEDFKKSIYQQFPVKVGEYLTKVLGVNGTGFVFSQLPIFRELLIYFLGAAVPVKESIRTFLRLPNDTNCDDSLVGLLSIIIQDAFKNGTIDHISMFYYDMNKELHDDNHTFRTAFRPDMKFPVDFRNKTVVLNTINAKYEQLSGIKGSLALQHGLNQKSNFYILDFINMKSSIFNTQSVNSTQQFTDLDGHKKNVEWVKMTGTIKVKTFNASRNLTLDFIRSTVVDGSLYLLYLRPHLNKFKNRALKCRYIQKVFSNLRKCVNKTLEDNFEKATSVDSLLVPLMDFRTDVDLKPVLMANLSTLFQPDQITELYKNEMNTLYEMRKFEDFSNKGVKNYTEDAGKVDITVDTPFVFVLIHKETQLIMKAGAYLGGKQV